MRRRDFIAGLGAAIPAAPFAAHGQQQAVPVVGFLSSASPDLFRDLVAAFVRGLGETGYAEGQNVIIEYRWAEGRNERIAALAADLVHRQVSVIAATTTPAAVAARATPIPTVFVTAADPVALGLVASLGRPGGNVTGVTFLSVEVGQKRLQLLHELLPTATTIAALINPTNSAFAETVVTELQQTARTLGLNLHVLHASTDEDLPKAFLALTQLRASGLVIGPDALFTGRSKQLAALALDHKVPTVYQFRDFTNAGGLLSYGTNLADVYRQAGVYTGRLLKGEKPSNLPVLRATKVELIINLKTAKALGLTVPLPLLGRADEVIE